MKPLRPWTADIDPGSIPDDVIKTERARRNARKRTSYTGGDVWAKHNPSVKGCRCAKCIAKRKRRAA